MNRFNGRSSLLCWMGGCPSSTLEDRVVWSITLRFFFYFDKRLNSQRQLNEPVKSGRTVSRSTLEDQSSFLPGIRGPDPSRRSSISPSSVFRKGSGVDSSSYSWGDIGFLNSLDRVPTPTQIYPQLTVLCRSHDPPAPLPPHLQRDVVLESKRTV